MGRIPELDLPISFGRGKRVAPGIVFGYLGRSSKAFVVGEGA
jgi:hypothetical protein